MKAIKLSLVFVLGFILGGCASIGGDNNRSVKVSSYPAGAAVYVDNHQFGTTPAVVTLPNYIYGGKQITVSKKGYQSQTKTITTKFQPIALLDFLFWPALVVDAITGNLVKINPLDSQLHYQLDRA